MADFGSTKGINFNKFKPKRKICHINETWNFLKKLVSFAVLRGLNLKTWIQIRWILYLAYGPELILTPPRTVRLTLSISSNELGSRLPLKPSFGPRGLLVCNTFFFKSGWVSIRTLLCFELQQIWDHFCYKKIKRFYNKSGLGFSVTQSIATLGLGTCNRIFQKNSWVTIVS